MVSLTLVSNNWVLFICKTILVATNLSLSLVSTMCSLLTWQYKRLLTFKCLATYSLSASRSFLFKNCFQEKNAFLLFFEKQFFFQNRNINIFSISRFCFFCFGSHFLLGSKIETEQNFDGFHLTGIIVAVVVDVVDFVVVDVVVDVVVVVDKWNRIIDMKTTQSQNKLGGSLGCVRLTVPTTRSTKQSSLPLTLHLPFLSLSPFFSLNSLHILSHRNVHYIFLLSLLSLSRQAQKVLFTCGAAFENLGWRGEGGRLSSWNEISSCPFKMFL